MKILAVMLATLLTGCDAQLGSNAATQSQLASINQHIAALDARMSALEQAIQTQQRSSGNWVLYDVSEAFNAGYPQALSAFSSKAECLSAADGWRFPGGTQVSRDPNIFQMKGYRIRLECLPVGTKPYAH